MEHFTLDELADRFFSDTTTYTKQDVLVDALKFSLIAISANQPVTEFLLFKLTEAVGEGDDESKDSLIAAIATLGKRPAETERLLIFLVDAVIAANNTIEED